LSIFFDFSLVIEDLSLFSLMNTIQKFFMLLLGLLVESLLPLHLHVLLLDHKLAFLLFWRDVIQWDKLLSCMLPLLLLN
jgi:hypothetical protein